MATIVRKGGAYFTKGQDGLTAISDPVQLRDITTGKVPYTDESFNSTDVYSPVAGKTPVPMTPAPADSTDTSTPYDKFNMSLMDMLKTAQTQSNDLSANKNLAQLQSGQAGAITGDVGSQFSGASPSQINSILSSRAGAYDPAINETAAVIQAKNQKINAFNDLVTQARGLGEDFAKNLVPDEATLQNYRDLIEADPNQMSTILSAAGNDKTRQKILSAVDFSKLKSATQTAKKRNTVVMKDSAGNEVLIDADTGETIKAMTGLASTSASDRQKTMDQLNTMNSALDAADERAGASGKSGLSQKASSFFIGASDFTELQSNVDTLRTNLMTMSLDPNIKKFFGPQMTEQDVRMMSSAANPIDVQSMRPDMLRSELAAIRSLVNRAHIAVATGMQSSTGNPPAQMKLPDGKIVNLQSDGTYK
jgi:hypothetical protein